MRFCCNEKISFIEGLTYANQNNQKAIVQPEYIFDMSLKQKVSF